MELVRECPVCHNSAFEPWLACQDYSISKEPFQLIKCATCNLVITSPRPDAETLGRYYESDVYISHTGKPKTFVDRVYLQARKITLGWKRKLITRHHSHGTLLDIGCGTGEFLHFMQANGFNVSGIEVSTAARERARSLLKTQIQTSIDELPHDFTTDVVTLWHVLEHVPNPDSTLRKIHSILEKNGTIFIAVPNLESYDASYYRDHWAGYDVPRHLWHFRQKNITQILDNQGFKMMSIIPMRLDAFYVSMLSESYRNNRQPEFIKLIKAFWIGLKSNWKAKKENNYSSLIYIAKKK